MKTDMVELIFLVAVAVVFKIFEHTSTGKKWKEKQKRREEAEREAAERDEAEWQEGLEERLRAAEKTQELSFEIPAMRPSEPDAETKLPQADRIFVCRKEPVEEKILIDYEPDAIKLEETSKPIEQVKTKSVNTKYQAWLKRNPTTRDADAVSTSIRHTLDETRDKTNEVRIPTSRDRLIEGIILAEVLGKPKAYQNRRRF